MSKISEIFLVFLTHRARYGPARFSRVDRLIRFLPAVMMLAAIHIGYAAPPDVGSEDYEILTPHSAWLHEQKNPTTGVGCCDLSDCRTVEWRAHGNQIEMFISSKKYVDGPNKWVEVPQSVIHQNANPVGKAIACWSAWRQMDNGFYCVWLDSLT